MYDYIDMHEEPSHSSLLWIRIFDNDLLNAASIILENLILD